MESPWRALQIFANVSKGSIVFCALGCRYLEFQRPILWKWVSVALLTILAPSPQHTNSSDNISASWIVCGMTFFSCVLRMLTLPLYTTKLFSKKYCASYMPIGCLNLNTTWRRFGFKEKLLVSRFMLKFQ